MTPLESLHYAIGELAYSVAFSDGAVQREEREKFQEIVTAEMRNKDYSFDVADIIFKILDKQKMDSSTVYAWAMKEIKLNHHYLSPELKQTFISVMEKIAAAFPPVTTEENNVIEKFKNDISSIEGDPTYYERKNK
jgi:uncharacterized tellurite resistance protein B-like protein